MKTAASLVVALALTGCVASSAAGPLVDSWGGRGIALTLDAGGGRLEYDCAAGTIDGPLVPDAGGRFAVGGTHTPGLGGPARVDSPPASFSARYTGIVRGREMQLEIAVPARALNLGPFMLRRGEQAVLLRCL